ncbi:4Fe-4S dicluster domain-containing protein [Blattabacterium cuenoti]|uniref:4Fe-4S dicluster domain-containing protein n=1 Tax=Blattabacterium cuenoti TaxID=1653831 RepID=UPI00163C7938|nr:4Fe-4S dicluster domain-containing protein [Blattabacterium cuenoti]
MSIKITEECINCGACEPECPNKAIYEGGKKWSISDGTSKPYKPIFYKPKRKDIYFIISEKCTECIGFYDQPQCMTVCPVHCCVLDKIETKEKLLKKKFLLHEPK